jgi:uncharacterized metal-binding protein
LTLNKMWIIPCSGIGKTYGSIARESAFVVTEDLCPEKTRIMALSRLVPEDSDVRAEIHRAGSITIDGCKLSCAAKVVAAIGGRVVHELQVLDAYRAHPDLKPAGITELNEDGRRLARILAEKATALVDAMQEERDA